jgi:glutamine synthetase
MTDLKSAPAEELAARPATGTRAGPAREPADAEGGTQLERWIGRPAAAWSVDDLVRVFHERGLRLLGLMHVGGDGQLKTLDFAPRDPDHLRRILEGGERADGSSLFPGLGIPAGASDVILKPRPGTAFLDPFSPLPTMVVLCGHAGRDGAPLPQSPDTVIRRAHERLQREAGCALHALGEVEFFLCRPLNEHGEHGANDRGYHATAPFVFGEALRRRALGLLGDIGIAVKYAHSEVGFVPAEESGQQVWEQHEIELDLAPLPAAADAVVLARWILMRLAQAEGMGVRFDPVIRRGHAGTGLHFHFAPVVRGERERVRGTAGALSDPARWLIGGLVRHGTALMAFGNRADGSFLRLAQALEAPRGVVWGESDRSALVRLPIVPRDAQGWPVFAETVEFRLPDGSAHPHLLLAGVAQAMCDASATAGLDRMIAAAAAGAGAQESGPGSGLPRSFAEVAVALRSSRAMLEAGAVFPTEMLDRTIARLES